MADPHPEAPLTVLFAPQPYYAQQKLATAERQEALANWFANTPPEIQLQVRKKLGRRMVKDPLALKRPLSSYILYVFFSFSPRFGFD